MKTHGEGASAPCKENSDTFYEELMNDIGIYGTEYVYNADETGIFYKIAPTKTIARKHRSGFKILKDRVSALFCCNMSGTDKRTPLIIGLPIKTTLLNNFNYRNYVQYTHSNKAWMTAPLFNNWLKEWDIDLQFKKKTIVLYFDNCH